MTHETSSDDEVRDFGLGDRPQAYSGAMPSARENK